MAPLSLTRLAVAAGSLALSLSAGVGIASANPDLGPIVNTTCNYGQVMAALNAQDPAAAADFNASPMAQSFLRSFLASPPDKRQRLALQVQAMPEAQQYIGTITQVAGSCNSY
ncbi:hemophore-related protein [Mycobacterium sp. M1]|uniref:Hemophore-related protein n=1 Tax=Mycolicibacter acidiphilus TaxID=2835306 RepID=A0ABS5RJT9_9MYCO|nr:hemophore-related protein [Mycolicibacter acidiphilus]MBS9534572.1 hemophore-related protein [Mycolicibacter acidiphilus]